MKKNFISQKSLKKIRQKQKTQKNSFSIKEQHRTKGKTTPANCGFAQTENE